MQVNRNSTEIYKKKIASLINESIDEIDIARALAAKERAERRLAEGNLETLAQTRARLALARANNRINIKNKKL